MSFGDKNTVDVRNSEVSVFGRFSLVKYIRIHSVLQIYGRFSEVVGIGKLHCIYMLKCITIYYLLWSRKCLPFRSTWFHLWFS